MTYKLSFSFSIFVAASAFADGAWKPDTINGKDPRVIRIPSTTARFISSSFRIGGQCIIGRSGGRMQYVSLGILFLGLVLISTASLPAPHAIAAKFDTARPLTLKGTVTLVDWANPHVHVFVNVLEGNALANWAIELESPIDLQRSGWNRTTLKPGDGITVQGI